MEIFSVLSSVPDVLKKISETQKLPRLRSEVMKLVKTKDFECTLLFESCFFETKKFKICRSFENSTQNPTRFKTFGSTSDAACLRTRIKRNIRLFNCTETVWGIREFAHKVTRSIQHERWWLMTSMHQKGKLQCVAINWWKKSYFPRTEFLCLFTPR